jgi:hypothetical protein
MDTVLTWLLISSKDPEKVSLTIKGILTGAIPVITIVLGLAHIQVGDLTPFVDGIINVVQTALAAIAAVMTVWGLFRKIILTLKGQHAGLNAM